MALLLTFFVMLVSFTDFRSEEKYQALVDSFQQQFAYQKPTGQLNPGELRPRSLPLAQLAERHRAQFPRMGEKGQLLTGESLRSPDRQSPSLPSARAVLYFQQENLELVEGRVGSDSR
jgi:hypothetical protein